MKYFKDKKLGDEQLEEVTGGVIFNNRRGSQQSVGSSR